MGGGSQELRPRGAGRSFFIDGLFHFPDSHLAVFGTSQTTDRIVKIGGLERDLYYSTKTCRVVTERITSQQNRFRYAAPHPKPGDGVPRRRRNTMTRTGSVRITVHLSISSQQEHTEAVAVIGLPIYEQSVCKQETYIKIRAHSAYKEQKWASSPVPVLRAHVAVHAGRAHGKVP